MATFSSGPVASTFSPNANFDLQGAVQDGQKTQANALALVGAQQDQADRATFRNNAAGMIAKDPTATGLAMGANPAAAQSFLNSIPGMDADTRAQTMSDMDASSSLAGSVLMAPPEQQAAVWANGRAALAQTGHKNLPPEQFPGAGAMFAMRGMGLTAKDLLTAQSEIPTTNPAGPLAYPSNGAGPSSSNNAGSAADQAAFVKQWGPQAARIAPSLGVSPDVVLAHWGQETGWGSSVHGNNVGNITAGSGYQGASMVRGDTDGNGNPITQTFRSYATPDAAADDYARLLKSKYQGALGGGADAGKFGSGLLAGGYMTNKGAPGQIAAAAQNLRGLSPAVTAALSAPTGATAPAAAPAPAPAPAPVASAPSSADVTPAAAPTQVASLAGTPGIPATATDASTPAPIVTAAATPPVAPAPAMTNSLAAVGANAGSGGPAPAPNALSAVGGGIPAPPPGSEILLKHGLPIPASVPGYVQTRAPDNSYGMTRLPGAPPKIKTIPLPSGQVLNIDENTGQEVGPRLQTPSTARLTLMPNAAGGTDAVNPSGEVVRTTAGNSRDVQLAAYKRDADNVDKMTAQSTQLEQSLQQTLEARNLAKGLATGAGGDARANISSWVKTYAPDSVYQSVIKSGFLPDSPQAEQTAKLLLRGAATDEQQLGGSGGLGMTEKFQKANPSLNMQPQSIQAISNLKAVTAQSAKDYNDGAMAYFNPQQDKMLRPDPNVPGTYSPLSDFNQQWHSQRNVGTYMAAVDAMNGKPFAQWSKGLAGPEQDRALQIISRIDPSTTVQGPRGWQGVVKGGLVQAQGAGTTQPTVVAPSAPAGIPGSGSGSAQPSQPAQVSAPAASAAPARPAAPAVGAVMGGYRFNGGDPASPASWVKAQ